MYCSVCDATQLNYFGFADKTIAYDAKFCGQMLKAHMDYLRFINVVYIRYVDQILQYIQCFESNGQVFSFPFQNFLRKYLRRITFWEKCFEAVAAGDYQAACWNICNKWSITGVSPLFDGDLALLERISATVFSFLRKWKFEEDAYAPVLANRTAVTWQRENVFNLQATDNVNGMMMEPMHPGMYITNDRYTPNKEFQEQFFNVSSSLGMSPRLQQEEAVNDMLKIAKLGDWKRMASYMIQPHVIMQVKAPLNQNLLAIEDREKSVVNGLLNKLYVLKTEQELTPSLRQPRYLRRQITGVLKEVGVRPSHYQRSLHDYEWKGLNVTFNGTYTPQSQIRPRLHDRIDAYGRPITYPNATRPLSSSGGEDENPAEFEIETPYAMHEAIQVHPGIEDFAYTVKEKGVHPMVASSAANYRFNVSQLIGMQYQNPEKLDNDVILAFMNAQAKNINNFNECVDEFTLPLKELQLQFPQAKKYEKIVWLKAIINIDKQYGLYKLLEMKELEIQREQVTKVEEAEKTKKKKKEYKKALKAVAQYNMDEVLKFPKDIHRGNGMFDELFQSIADLFIGLFGS